MSFAERLIRRPVATVLLAVAVASLGLFALPRLPVAPLPEIDFPTILVTASLSGASAETMAASVATPLERQFAQIADVSEMTSFSALGATSITVQFGLGRNSDAAAQDIQAAITAASKILPQAMTAPPSYRKVNPADAPILMLAVESKSLPITVVNEYADNFLAQQIAHIAGVAQVSLGGEQRPAIRVQVDPAKLAASGLTLEDVRTALVAETSDRAKGTLTGARTSFTITANDQITDATEYDDLILAWHNSGAIRLRDIGHAVLGPTDRFSAAFHNNNPAVLLNIYRQPGANTIETVERIKKLLPALTANIPAAISVTTVLDRTNTIRASVTDGAIALLLTIALVIGVSVVFLRNIWATAIAGITIFVGLLGAFAAMGAFEFSLDNLSLMALTIAIGFMIDDAFVVVENIYRHVENGSPPIDAAIAGSRQIAFTLICITLSLIAVFIPLLFMGGIAGRLFGEFAVTVTAAVLVSAALSLTLAPTLCARVALKPAPPAGPFWFTSLTHFYERTLDAALRRRAVTLGVFLGTMGLTMILAVEMPKGFFPLQDTGMLQGLAEAAQGVSPDEMMRLQKQIGDVLLQDDDIAGFASQTGSIGPNGNAQTANTARFFIALKPRSQRTHTAREVIDRLRPRLARITGVSLALTPTQDITVGGRARRGDFQYTLKDTNFAELTRWSGRLLDKMRSLPEITDAQTDLLAAAPQLRLTINRDHASRFGISPEAIDDTLNDAFGQRQVTQYYTQLDTYWVVLEITPELQGSFSSLDKLYVKSAQTGVAVPLSVLVSVDSAPVGPLSIIHDDEFPAVTLSFNLRDGVALGQAIQAISEAARDIGMPSGVIRTFTGNAGAFQTALANGLVLIVVGLLAIYVILGMLYESFLHPLTILSTLPSAGAGALLALRIGHMDLSVIGIIGIVLLIGIVKKNGIILIDFAIVAEREKGAAPAAAIREACLLRLRPILMTTFAALLAGIPLAILNGTGSELRQPLGFVIVGGLALSQLLTLYTTPVLYLSLGDLHRFVVVHLKRWNGSPYAPMHQADDDVSHASPAIEHRSTDRQAPYSLP